MKTGIFWLKRILSGTISLIPARFLNTMIRYVSRPSSFHFKNRFSLILIQKVYNNYHPLKLPGLSQDRSDRRDVAARMTAIKDFLGGRGCADCFDLGCNGGYFALELAKMGLEVEAIDADAILINRCNILKSMSELDNIRFSRGEFNLEMADTMRPFDVFLCMAVFHHVISVRSESYARELLKKIHSKTGKFLIFEMASSLEKGRATADGKLLPDMGPDPDVWIIKFIEDAGFKNVKRLGAFKIDTGNRRTLFAAEA